MLRTRRDARVDDAEARPLEDQDRSLWNGAEIAEAIGVAGSQRRGDGRINQACIAAVHALAPVRSNRLARRRPYGKLVSVMSSPVVELNRAVAVAMAEGPAAEPC
jgi:RNA polymerase sigma-70 factor (ECF subfamily)